jgi:hypothetical protein
MPTPAPIQIATATVVSSIVGGDLGPGTKAMIRIDTTFTSPITAGSAIVLIVTGRITQPGQNIILGGIPGGFSYSGGTGSPIHDHVVAVTYSDANFEIMLGPPTTVTIPTGAIILAGRPNPNLSILPGALNWSVYIDGLKVATLLPNQDFSGGPGGGAGLPPTTPIHDTLGNNYAQVIWTDGGLGGSQFGTSAMGVWVSGSSPGGANTISFVAAGYNQNPFFTTNMELDAIALEYASADFSAPSSVAGNSIQQGNATHPMALSLTGINIGTITTDFGGQTECASTVADILSTRFENLFAILTGDDVAATPLAPALIPGPLIYTPLAHVIGSGGFPLWVWSTGLGPLAAKPTTAREAVKNPIGYPPQQTLLAKLKTVDRPLFDFLVKVDNTLVSFRKGIVGVQDAVSSTGNGGGGGTSSNPMTTLGDIITGGSGGVPSRLGIGTPGEVLSVVSGVPAWTTLSGGGIGGMGTVTSVALSMPTEFSVAGSPITAAGTLAVAKAVEPPNTVWAGPASGAAAVPGFRALVAADIPVLGSTVPNFVREIPTGVLDGANVTFTLSFTPNPSASLLLFLNGVEQVPTVDFTIVGTTATYTIAPVSDDLMIAQYTH